MTGKKGNPTESSSGIQVGITAEPLDIAVISAMVETADSGAVNVFVGTVRNHFDGRQVVALEYECFVPMAEKILHQICEDAAAAFEVKRIAVRHRYGKLSVGEPSVVIAVSSAHRDAAFKASRQIIEGIKLKLPVWKKEHFEDGSAWKEGTVVPG